MTPAAAPGRRPGRFAHVSSNHIRFASVPTSRDVPSGSSGFVLLSISHSPKISTDALYPEVNPMTVPCPSCSVPLAIPNGKSGLFLCPRCQATVAVPSPDVQASTPARIVFTKRRMTVVCLVACAALLLSFCAWIGPGLVYRTKLTMGKPAFSGTPFAFYSDTVWEPTKHQGELVEFTGVVVDLRQDSHGRSYLDLIESADSRPHVGYMTGEQFADNAQMAALAPQKPSVLAYLDTVEAIRARSFVGKTVTVRGWCNGLANERTATADAIAIEKCIISGQ